jgi:hypothetical protein
MGFERPAEPPAEAVEIAQNILGVFIDAIEHPDLVGQMARSVTAGVLAWNRAQIDGGA